MAPLTGLNHAVVWQKLARRRADSIVIWFPFAHCRVNSTVKGSQTTITSPSIHSRAPLRYLRDLSLLPTSPSILRRTSSQLHQFRQSRFGTRKSSFPRSQISKTSFARSISSRLSSMAPRKAILPCMRSCVNSQLRTFIPIFPTKTVPKLSSRVEIRMGSPKPWRR